jgi:RNA polymerase subunit RPABC4/transcription elongation factor Spt4
MLEENFLPAGMCVECDGFITDMDATVCPHCGAEIDNTWDGEWVEE